MRVVRKFLLVLSEQLQVKKIPLITLRVPVVQGTVPRFPPLHFNFVDLPVEVLWGYGGGLLEGGVA